MRSFCMLCAAIVLLAGAGAEQVWAQPAAPVPQGRAAAEASGFALKKRIAVLRVDAGGLGAQYGDVGNAIAAQLTTALFQTGQFVVIERAELAAVLREQEMGEKAITAPGSATRLGGLLGAQLLVRAVVTEFDLKNQGSGVRIGVGGANLLGGLGVAANTGVVALDVRLIDAATGAVTQTQRVEAKMESRGASVDLGARGASIGGDTFEKTPLGQATREAIDKAVAFIVGAAKPVPWTALVADVAGDQVFVNAGAAAGLRQGDVLAVSALVRQLTDPGSGEVLGTMERPSGQVEIVEVQERFSVARMLAPFEAKRGDYVRPAAR